MSTDPYRVVVVGAGFGGLAVTRALDVDGVEITIIDARNHHTFQPLLYQVATAGLDVDDVCHPVRAVFHRQPNVRVRLARVTDVDAAQRQVVLDNGEHLGYDALVLACGAITNTFGVEGVAEHTYELKSSAHAIALRNQILSCFEAADADPAAIEAGVLNFAIVGAGPTGVELAGGIAELVHRVLRRDFPRLDVDRTRIVLVEATDRVLGAFHPELSGKARRSLQRLGVEIMTATQVSSVGPDGVSFTDGSRLQTRTVVWAAGVKAHPLGATSDLTTDAAGRVLIDDALAAVDHPDIFAIGDIAATRSPDGGLLPQVAPVAIQGGQHVAATIRARVGGGSGPGPFEYRYRGDMATIGRHSAVAQLPSGHRFGGPIGWLAWLGLHLIMLIGIRNRVRVFITWAWNYITFDRGSRAVIADRNSRDSHPNQAIET